VKRYGADHEFTKLVVNLKGQDPDDSFSTVPYDKGYTFLDYLERTIGSEAWDEFIPHVSLILPPGALHLIVTVFSNMDAQVTRLVRVQGHID
jgi:hypothetical protein